MTKVKTILGFDILLLASTISLIIIGIFFIFSSGVNSTGQLVSYEYIKQIIWASLGIFVLLFFAFFDYSRFEDWGLQIYLFFMFLLIITLLIGQVVNGARSWLGIWEFGVQPSEFTKIAVILFLASFFQRQAKKKKGLASFLLALGIVLLPFFLVFLQPDMGTALVYLPVFLCMAFAAGYPLRYILFLLGSGALMTFFALLGLWAKFADPENLYFIVKFFEFRYFLIPLGALFLIFLISLWGCFGLKRSFFYWIIYGCGMLFASLSGAFFLIHKLRSYQAMRLIVFIDPSIQPRGAGWNIIQSMTAIGSGGLNGKGFLKGTQSHLRFLPQQSTDFIFSIIGEEWGFIGGCLVLLLFLIILLRIVIIMFHAKDRFGSYICAGLLGMYSFHILINIGMTMGSMPITGIPLFFLSYGGSSLWTGMVGIGLLINIYLRRYRN